VKKKTEFNKIEIDYLIKCVNTIKHNKNLFLKRDLTAMFNNKFKQRNLSFEVLRHKYRELSPKVKNLSYFKKTVQIKQNYILN
jgi:hypothetical protein